MNTPTRASGGGRIVWSSGLCNPPHNFARTRLHAMPAEDLKPISVFKDSTETLVIGIMSTGIVQVLHVSIEHCKFQHIQAKYQSICLVRKSCNNSVRTKNNHLELLQTINSSHQQNAVRTSAA